MTAGLHPGNVTPDRVAAGPARAPAPGPAPTSANAPAPGPLTKVPVWANRTPNPDPAARAAADQAVAADQAAPVADRLAAARRLIESAWLDPNAWETFRRWQPDPARPGGAERAVADQLWSDLALTDVAAGPKSAGAALRDRLVARISRVLAAHFAAETARLSQVTGRQSLAGQIELLWPEAPGLAPDTVADRTYHDTISVGRVADLTTEPAHSAAQSYWEALRAAAKKPLETVRGRELAPAATGRLDPQEIAAVRAALEPMTTWVATAQETDRLADQVVTLGRGAPQWQPLRDRLAVLVTVAETQIINATLKPGTGVTPQIWAELRQYYVNEISKPIWRYWADNVVDTTVFGHPVHKSTNGEGLHRDVIASLRAVEQSAVRLAGVRSVKDLRDVRGPANRGRGMAITQPGTEFRFEAMSHLDWMRKAKRVSYHGTGRAIDFRSDTNPAIFTDNVRQLVSMLGQGELAEQTISREELTRWARTLAGLEDRASQAEAQAAAEADPIIHDQLTAVAEQLRAQRTTAPQNDPVAAGLRGRAGDVYDRIRGVEGRFRFAWLLLNLDNPTYEELMIRLQYLVGSAIGNAQREIDDLTARSAQPNAPKAALNDQLALVTAKLTRLHTLEAGLLWSREPDHSPTNEQAAVLDETRAVAASGLNDLPKWMVQAFVEQGWSWGASWRSPYDAMHFDYMGPIADVR